MDFVRALVCVRSVESILISKKWYAKNENRKMALVLSECQPSSAVASGRLPPNREGRKAHLWNLKFANDSVISFKTASQLLGAFLN